MHSISIQFKETTSQNEIWQKFHSVIGQMRENGQINGRETNPHIQNNQILATLWTFTEEALEEKHWNKYVKTAAKILKIFAKIKLKFLI